MLVGYARVFAAHQNLDRQLAMLKAEGCERIFKEKLSGREGVRRPQLDKAIEALGTGDVLVLAEWDRVTRSMLDGIIERMAQPSRRSTGSGGSITANELSARRCPKLRKTGHRIK